MKLNNPSFIKKVLYITTYVFITIFVIVCIYLLKTLKNDSLFIDNSLDDTTNNIDRITNSLDSSEEILDSIKDLHSNYNKFSISIEQTDIVINHVKPIYLKKNDLILARNRLIEFTDINLYDFDKAFTILNKSKELSLQEPSLIENISLNKEDKINKVNYITEGYDEQYLSSKGFSDEYIKFYNDVYPIGSIYISYNGTCPSIGTWECLSSIQTLKKDIIGMVLEGETGEETIPFEGVLLSSSDGSGDFVAPIMPNITGNGGPNNQSYTPITGDTNPFYAVYSSSKKTNNGAHQRHNMIMNLNAANPIYQDYATIRPASIGVVMFKRIG